MEEPQAYELEQLGCPPTPVDCDTQGKEVKKGRKEKTTVMLRNLPNNYSREMFLEMLDNQGLKGLYDFAYLPCDFYRDVTRREKEVLEISARRTWATPSSTSWIGTPWNCFGGAQRKAKRLKGSEKRMKKVVFFAQKGISTAIPTGPCPQRRSAK